MNAEPTQITDATEFLSLEIFHNAVRILYSIDLPELHRAGLHLEADAWVKFAENPPKFFIKADDLTAGVIWEIVQTRMPKRGPSL